MRFDENIYFCLLQINLLEQNGWLNFQLKTNLQAYFNRRGHTIYHQNMKHTKMKR